MKIVSSGRVLNSVEFYKKKKRRRRLKLILLLIGLLAILSSLIYFSRQGRFLITGVTVTGENVVDREEMAQVARDLISGYYLWVVPRANTFIYPRRAIKQSLISKFPRLQSINLKLDERRILDMAVVERTPLALYCVNTDECFFLDKEGFIFALAPAFSNGVYFVYSTKDPIENPVGKRFVTPEEFEALSKFMKALPALNLHPSALEIGADDYSLLLSNGGYLMWRKGDDLLLIRSNLEAFLSSDSIRTQNNFLGRVLYLDLRTENKVFYKFQE